MIQLSCVNTVKVTHLKDTNEFVADYSSICPFLEQITQAQFFQ